jgi:hypothetical protein
VGVADVGHVSTDDGGGLVASLKVKVDTNGLPEKLSVFTHTQAKQALRSGVGKTVTRGRNTVRRLAPRRTGIGAAGIKSTTRTRGYTITGRVFPSGDHAHIMRWQDQGTGPRHTRRTDAYRGEITPQYFFERGAMQIEAELPVALDVAIEAGLVKSGLK